MAVAAPPNRRRRPWLDAVRRYFSQVASRCLVVVKVNNEYTLTLITHLSILKFAVVRDCSLASVGIYRSNRAGHRDRRGRSLRRTARLCGRKAVVCSNSKQSESSRYRDSERCFCISNLLYIPLEVSFTRRAFMPYQRAHIHGARVRPGKIDSAICRLNSTAAMWCVSVLRCCWLFNKQLTQTHKSHHGKEMHQEELSKGDKGSTSLFTT